MAVLNQAVLFAEKLWIVLGIGALIGLAIVIWCHRSKSGERKNLR
jgi:hypothetical protein